MSDATQAAGPDDVPGQSEPLDYDAFLSYTHSDRPVVSGIQKGLHRIGRRMGQLRALRVFRDDTDLVANPDLWRRITEGLDRSRYLVVTLSPEAAQSIWVNKEVSYWLEHRGGEQLLLVLAAGQLRWDEKHTRFDPASDAALPVLTKRDSLPAEPLYINVSEDAPWDYRAPVFHDKITALAAPIHGKPKAELASDDLREQRRFRRFRAAAITGLVVLAIAAGVGFVQATNARHRAEDLARRAIASRLVSEAEDMLAGHRAGGDVQALQQLLAAHALAGRNPDGGLLDGVIKRMTTGKIADVGTTLHSAAFRPDGHRFATGGDNGSVRLWDSDTGQSIGPSLTPEQSAQRSMVHPNAMTVVFSPDGHRLAAGGYDDMIRLWNADTGQPIGAPIKSGTLEVMSLVFSPDGHRLASAGDDARAFRIWNVDTGQPIGAPITVPGAGVQSLAFSPDGNRVATGGTDATVRLWDVITGQPAGTPMTAGQGSVGLVVFSPDGRRLISGGGDHAVRTWNPETGQLIRFFNTGDGGALTFNAHANRIATSDASHAIQVWDVDTGQPVGAPLDGHREYVHAAAFSSDGRRLLSGGEDHTVRVWNLDADEPLTGHLGNVDTVASSPDGHTLASGGGGPDDDTVRLWNAETRDEIGAPLTGHTGIVTAVAFSPDGHRLASAQNYFVLLWNAETGQQLVRLPTRNLGVLIALGFSPDGHRLMAAGQDGGVVAWNVDTGQPLGEPMNMHLKGGFVSAAFSPNGHQIAAGVTDNTIQMWNADTGQAIGAPMTGHTNNVSGLAFSPDGHRLVSGGGRDRSVRLWEVASGRQIGDPLSGHTGAITSVAFSPDEVVIASGDDHGELRLWDSRTGDELGSPIAAHAREVSSVAFSPDGHRLASASWDATIRLWPATAEPKDLCDKLTTNISPKQWRDWVSPDIPYKSLCPGLPPKRD